MGGTDEDSNIEYLSVAEHAERHRKLYEQYGNWRDKIAWIGLSGIIPHEDVIQLMLSEAGREGAELSNLKQGVKGKRRKHKRHKRHNYPIRDRNKLGKIYKIVTPIGEIITVKNLCKWCEDNDIKFKSFHKSVIQRKSFHKGYKLFRG